MRLAHYAGWLLMMANCAWAQVPKPPTVVSPKPEAFVVFDGLLNPDKPNLRRLGLTELRGSDHVWRPGVSRERVDPAGVTGLVDFLATLGNAYYLDIENWPVYGVPSEVAQANVDKLIRVADLARETAPNRRFGFYGLLPQHLYWAFVLKKQSDIDAWHRSNEISAPLATHVDFVLPSLYTFYNDPEGWKTVARAMLTEARRYHKPVYPFLWPAYHDSNKELGGQEVPRDFWRMQLELVHEYADGVVIWGGSGQKWNENAVWWIETKDFLKTLN